MRSLVLSDSDLLEIPDLSQNTDLKELYVDSNQLCILWHIPEQLELLDCAYNYIISDGLPTSWPNKLKEINLDSNNIYDTDQVIDWPNALEVLRICQNPLRKIPRHLPNTLIKICMKHTDIQIIEHLPDSVEIINLYHSCVDTIYTLPRGLKECYLAKNYLTYLHSFSWPQSLRVLDLAFNKLSEFPSLPDSIEHLNLANNQITEVPERLPFKLNTIILRNNRVRNVYTTSKHKILIFNLANNCLIEAPQLDVTLDVSSNFIEPYHNEFASMIQRGFKVFKAKKELKTWNRTGVLREELLRVAMAPNRWGNF